jgi:hypothetical protein
MQAENSRLKNLGASGFGLGPGPGRRRDFFGYFGELSPPGWEKSPRIISLLRVYRRRPPAKK